MTTSALGASQKSPLSVQLVTQDSPIPLSLVGVARRDELARQIADVQNGHVNMIPTQDAEKTIRSD